jgi:hypothetical protein
LARELCSLSAVNTYCESLTDVSANLENTVDDVAVKELVAVERGVRRDTVNLVYELGNLFVERRAVRWVVVV